MNLENIQYKESEFNVRIKNEENILIYNTLTGAMVSIPSHHELSYDEGKQWIKEGLLVEKNKDEFNYFVSQRQSVKWNPKPKALSFTISTTMKCQAHCEYCFEKDIENKISMNVDTAQKTGEFIVKMLKETEAKVLFLTFFGGEPTLNVQVIEIIGKRCSDFCKAYNIKFSSTMITNGILMNTELFNAINPLINLSRVQITLDGTRVMHDKTKGIICFDKVVKNIADLSFKTKIIIRLNITRDNSMDMEQLLNEVKKHSLNFDNVTIYFARVRGDYGVRCDTNCMSMDEFNLFKCKMYDTFYGDILKKEQLLPAVKKTFCGWERRFNYCIGPLGLLYKCNHDIGKENKSVGNVWYGNTYNQYEMKFMESIPEQCLKDRCYMIPICQGGCIMERGLHKSQDCIGIKKSVVDDLNMFYKLSQK